MGDRLGIQVAVDILLPFCLFSCLSSQNHHSGHLYIVSHHIDCLKLQITLYTTHSCHTLLAPKKCLAPGEARTHGLQIMRLTRCLLRYGGWWEASVKASPLETVGTNICQNYLSEVGFEPTPS